MTLITTAVKTPVRESTRVPLVTPVIGIQRGDASATATIKIQTMINTLLVFFCLFARSVAVPVSDERVPTVFVCLSCLP